MQSKFLFSSETNQVMSDETFTIICEDGEIITVEIDLLKKIPYFKGLLEGGYSETIDNTLVLESNSKFACDSIFSFIKDGRIDLPISSLHCEECLGLAQYWSLDQYTTAFLNRFIAEYGQEKGKIVDIINYIALTDQMLVHRSWLSQQITRLLSIPRLHMLCIEAIQNIVNLFSQEKTKSKYLFPLLRDWYLFDQDKNKIPIIVNLIDRCPIEDFSLSPRHQTLAFLNKFPDPILSKKIAIWAVTKTTF